MITVEVVAATDIVDTVMRMELEAVIAGVATVKAVAFEDVVMKMAVVAEVVVAVSADVEMTTRMVSY